MCRARTRLFQECPFMAVRQARFFAECERCAHLNARGARLQSFHHLLGRAISSGKPEGNTHVANLLQINGVALAVNWLSAFIKLKFSAGRRIVAASCGSLNDET